jgi:hypothetical protein
MGANSWKNRSLFWSVWQKNNNGPELDRVAHFCYTMGTVDNKEQTMTDILITIGAIATLLTMRAYFKGWRWDEV